jgi:transcriptional regulator with XRE-family HTH domain
VEEMLQRLETYRLENKITQQQITEKLGVAFSTVNRWLNRHVKPNKIQSYQIQKLIGEEASRGKRKK